MIISLLAFNSLQCQSQSNKKMDFETYDPVSTLVVPKHIVTKSKISFHRCTQPPVGRARPGHKKLVTEMDSLNLQVMVNLSGRGYRNSSGRNGDFDLQDQDYMTRYMASVAKVDARRVLFFTNISFVGFGEAGWAGKTVKGLESDVKAGARGLKIYKDLGMEFKDEKGKIIAVDDPRLDPVWDKCGELKYRCLYILRIQSLLVPRR